MPLLHLSIAFLCGVVLAAWLALSAGGWLALAGGGLAITLLPYLLRRLPVPARAAALIPNLLIPKFSPLPIPLLLAVLGLGAARYAATTARLSADHIAAYNDHVGRITVVGTVAAPPDTRDRHVLLEVVAESLQPDPLTAPVTVAGRLLAKVPPGDWRYGDRLQLSGWLSTPFETEDFSYLDYLAHRGIHSTFDCPLPLDERCAQVLATGGGSPVYRGIYALRLRLVSVLARLFPDPESSLLAGILLGVEGGIPVEVREAFNQTGTAHVIAISGFNFAIIAGLFATFFSRLLGPWKGMAAAMLGIALYAVLAGASAGIVRAAIMGGLSVFAAQIGRRQHGLNSLAFVGALMALHAPHVLWDVSFQLSFMATLGLILYADPLDAWFRALAGRRLPEAWVTRLAGPVGEYFLFTLAAQLTTLPLVLYYFRRLSVVSLIANPLILPVQPPVMVLGGLAALLGLAWLPLGQLAAYLAWPFVVYTIRVVEVMAQLPGGAWALERFDAGWLLVFYAGLFGWTAVGGRLRVWIAARMGAEGAARSRLAGPALALLVLVNVLVWRAALAAPDGRLHVTMLDVSTDNRSGAAFLIRTPAGRTLLIDGGPSPSALSDALGRRLPLGARRLDGWVVAWPIDDQLTALPPALERFPPQAVVWAGSPDAAYSARQLRAALTAARIPITEAQRGQALDLGDGARLEFVDITPTGGVLRLEWRHFSLLLPLGQDYETLEALPAAPPTALTALYLAGGGNAALNPSEWLARWRPQLALLSVAPADPRGLPDPQILDALVGYTVLRTDQHGWVELSTDGAQLWVEVERP